MNINARYKTKLTRPFLISPQLKRLLQVIHSSGGKGLLVGGCVRDHLLGLVPKDLDIEVYNIEPNLLESALMANFSVVAVGRSFGIFKVCVELNGQKENFDVALPRTENKEGFGHKGFVVATDPFMSFEEASKRRDFTINAMAIDPTTEELIDAHGGFLDLQRHILRHVSEAFSEDPLRVFRAAQFSARFLLTLDDQTKILCQKLKDELKTLSKERIFEEFRKLLLAKKPSIGLSVLRDTYAIDLFPELKALIDCPQDPIWHPEGDVWIHSLMVTDQAANLVSNSEMDADEKLLVVTGALCHDFGKPLTTIPKDGHIKSPGHEDAGAEPTRSFLDAIGFPKKWHDDVVALVKEHLKPHQLYRAREEVSDGAIRRLTLRVNIPRLLMVAKADFLGRTTEDALLGHDPSEVWLKEKVQSLLGSDLSPKPLILGRHLIAFGEKPGVQFKAILQKAFEAQMDGEFSDEETGILWLKKYLKK